MIAVSEFAPPRSPNWLAFRAWHLRMGACCSSGSSPPEPEAPGDTAGVGNLVGDAQPPNSGTPSVSASVPPLQPADENTEGSLLGHDIVIRSLSFRPDLEGERGSVIMWDEYEGLYTVELDRYRRRVFAEAKHLKSVV
jgi:hypothetical protein